MRDFYSIEENFKFLHNDIYVLLSNVVIESSLSENWLANWYMCNKYNTTRAIEKCAADLIIPKLKYSEIPQDEFKSVINRKLTGCCESYNDVELTLEDKLYMIKNIQRVNINESTLSYIIQDFECDDMVEYLESSFYKEQCVEKLSKLNTESKQILGMISEIKQNILEHKENKEELQLIKDCNNIILYKYKYVNESSTSDIKEHYKVLESLLENQSDKFINHTLDELNHCNKLIEYLIGYKESDKFIYEQAVEKFDKMVHEIFFEDTEIEVDEIVKLCQLTEALCEYESTLEASSRIITKGTEKITKAIGNASAKAKGLSKSDSKIGQIKRGAKVIDDRASDALNNKIDQILNFTRDQKREKIIEGKNTIRVSKVLKTIIGLLAGAAFVKANPLVGSALTLIGLLGARALSKATEAREKKRIMLELETELKITREKIEDAKGDNAKEQKYQLMRIESQLEKEIFRIKHGMKYY